MQYIQTSQDSYLEYVARNLKDIYEEKGLECNLDVDFENLSAEGLFQEFIGVKDIHKLDKKQILNYSVAVFGLLTDVKESRDRSKIERVLKSTFEYIEGYTADKGTQIKLFTLLYNIFKQNERYRHDVFIRLLDF